MFSFDTQQLETLMSDLDCISHTKDRVSAAEAAVELHRYATALHQSGLLSQESLARYHAEIDRQLGKRLMPDNNLGFAPRNSGSL